MCSSDALLRPQAVPSVRRWRKLLCRWGRLKMCCLYDLQHVGFVAHCIAAQALFWKVTRVHRRAIVICDLQAIVLAWQAPEFLLGLSCNRLALAIIIVVKTVEIILAPQSRPSL